jgi:hypothetical protein
MTITITTLILSIYTQHHCAIQQHILGGLHLLAVKLTLSYRPPNGIFSCKVCRDRVTYQQKQTSTFRVSNRTLHKHWSLDSEVMQPRKGSNITFLEERRVCNASAYCEEYAINQYCELFGGCPLMMHEI